MSRSLHTPIPGGRRTKLLEATALLILQKGARGLTLDAVSQAANVSKGGLLYHFESKVSLLEAVLDYLAEQFVLEVGRTAASDRVRTGSVARAYLRTVAGIGEVQGNRQFWRALPAICMIQPGLFPRLRCWLDRLSSAADEQDRNPVDALNLRLVADGLWLTDLLEGHAISAVQLAALFATLGVETSACATTED